MFKFSLDRGVICSVCDIVETVEVLNGAIPEENIQGYTLPYSLEDYRIPEGWVENGFRNFVCPNCTPKQDNYCRLVVVANDITIRIWLGDPDGHLVATALGVLDVDIIPGEYVLTFGTLDNDRHKLHFTESRILHENVFEGAKKPDAL